jgi:hypothetical protein
MFNQPDPADVRRLEAELAGFVTQLNPDAVTLPDAPELWAGFHRIARLADAATVLLARKVDESEQWRQAGDRDAATYLARHSGNSIAAARRTLTTSKRLRHLPVTRNALLHRNLSATQSEAIADAATNNPDAEQRLLTFAERSNGAELCAECLRAKTAGDPDPDTTHHRIHTQRRLRIRTDAEGAWCLEARGTAQDGALVTLALEPLITDLFNQSRNGDTPLRRETLAFDALIELSRRAHGHNMEPHSEEPDRHHADRDDDVERPAGSRRRRRRRKHRGATTPNYTALLRLDLTALTRGHPIDDELCEITGIGPVPVTVARQLSGESILHLVLTKGTDVANITHLGRGPNAVQRLALLWQNPGRTAQACPCTLIDADHRIDWTITHHTRLDETDLLCDFHHNLKTQHGWALVQGHGKQPMVPPNDPRHPDHQQTQPVAVTA